MWGVDLTDDGLDEQIVAHVAIILLLLAAVGMVDHLGASVRRRREGSVWKRGVGGGLSCIARAAVLKVRCQPSGDHQIPTAPHPSPDPTPTPTQHLHQHLTTSKLTTNLT
jgi:hypothetical protein